MTCTGGTNVERRSSCACAAMDATASAAVIATSNRTFFMGTPPSGGFYPRNGATLAASNCLMRLPSFLAAAFFPLAVLAQSGPTPTPTDPNVEMVKRVQERLHANGYDVGPVNGVLDMRTQAAIAQFQLSQAMPAGGTIDRDTLKALGIDWAELEVEQAAATGSASAGE